MLGICSQSCFRSDFYYFDLLAWTLKSMSTCGILEPSFFLVKQLKPATSPRFFVSREQEKAGLNCPKEASSWGMGELLRCREY